MGAIFLGWENEFCFSQFIFFLQDYWNDVSLDVALYSSFGATSQKLHFIIFCTILVPTKVSIFTLIRNAKFGFPVLIG